MGNIDPPNAPFIVPSVHHWIAIYSRSFLSIRLLQNSSAFQLFANEGGTKLGIPCGLTKARPKVLEMATCVSLPPKFGMVVTLKIITLNHHL